MSTALYLKYRPANFAELIGQEHIVEALRGAITAGKVPHAYLFVGPRGTGKTSAARIMARELGIDPHDLYEIDAASNNSVEEIRELREAVRTLPFRSPYKLYIIDEVHMLSKAAFNAFLKTLEEPPSHVKFILATTERHKVLDTITSRCQQLVFRAPNLDTLAKVAVKVAADEGYTLSGEAARLVALLGDGSFRDMLGVLQKVLHGVAGKKIGREEVERLAGAPKEELVAGYLEALLSGRSEEGLAVLDRVHTDHYDVKLFAELVLERLRLVMFARYAPKLYGHHAADLAEETCKSIEVAAKDAGQANLSAILSRLLDAHTRIALAPIKTLPLELLLIEK